MPNFDNDTKNSKVSPPFFQSFVFTLLTSDMCYIVPGLFKDCLAALLTLTYFKTVISFVRLLQLLYRLLPVVKLRLYSLLPSLLRIPFCLCSSLQPELRGKSL